MKILEICLGATTESPVIRCAVIDHAVYYQCEKRRLILELGLKEKEKKKKKSEGNKYD